MNHYSGDQTSEKQGWQFLFPLKQCCKSLRSHNRSLDETWDYLIISELVFDTTLTCWIFCFSHRRFLNLAFWSQRATYSIHSLLLSGLFLLDNWWKISTNDSCGMVQELQADEKPECHYQYQTEKDTTTEVKW